MSVLSDIEYLKNDGRRKSVIIITLAVAVALLMITLIGALAIRPGKEVVAMTVDGRVLPLPTLDEPFHSTERVLSWAADRIEEAYSMSFADIKEYPSKLTFMNPEVRQQFIDQLYASGVVDKVVAERRVLRAIRKDSPSLQKQGVQNGRHLWMIQMPLQLNFEGSNDIDRSSMVVTVVVGRANLTDYESGLVIGKVDFVRTGR